MLPHDDCFEYETQITRFLSIFDSEIANTRWNSRFYFDLKINFCVKPKCLMQPGATLTRPISLVSHLHSQESREMSEAGIQLSGYHIGCNRDLYQEPTSAGLGCSAGLLQRLRVLRRQEGFCTIAAPLAARFK